MRKTLSAMNKLSSCNAQETNINSIKQQINHKLGYILGLLCSVNSLGLKAESTITGVEIKLELCSESFDIGKITEDMNGKIMQQILQMDPIFSEQFFLPKNLGEYFDWEEKQKSGYEDNYKHAIIPIENFVGCKKNVEKYGFFSPDKDIIGLLYNRHGSGSINAIYHEVWHSIYDNYGEKKGLIFSEGFSGPKENEIQTFVINFLERREDIKNMYYSGVEYDKLRIYLDFLVTMFSEMNNIIQEYELISDRISQLVKSIGPVFLEIEQSYDQNKPFYKYFSGPVISQKEKENINNEIEYLLNRKQAQDNQNKKIWKNLNINSNNQVSLIPNNFIVEEVSSYDDNLLILRNKFGFLEKDSRQIGILLSIVEKLITDNDLGNINSQFILDGKKLLEDINKLSPKLREYMNEKFPNEDFSAFSYYGKVLKKQVEYEKLLDTYYFDSNEVMARIIDSLYSKTTSNTKDQFILDQETLDFLKLFQYKGEMIFKDGIEEYERNVGNK